MVTTTGTTVGTGSTSATWTGLRYSMEWFEWDQNNSGGVFDETRTLCHKVFIQAGDLGEAEMKAFALGIYYDGVFNEIDCECCGDRWGPPDIVREPHSKDIEAYAQYLANEYGWTIPDARLYYADGTVKEIFIQGRGNNGNS